MATTSSFNTIRNIICMSIINKPACARRSYSVASALPSPISSPIEGSAQKQDSLESYVTQLSAATPSLDKPILSSDNLTEQTKGPKRIPPSPGWAMRSHPELYDPPTLKSTHRLHVATLAFEAYNPDKQHLPLVIGFALQAAYHLGIPVTKPAAMPIKTELHTVLRSGFVHKKSQENFWRLTHRRIIKAYDTNEEVINRWINYLRQEGVRGTNVGIKAQRFLYRRPGWGDELKRLATQEVELAKAENPKAPGKVKRTRKTTAGPSFDIEVEPAATDPTAFGDDTCESMTPADEVKRLAEKLVEKELKPRADAMDALLKETGTREGKGMEELKMK